MSAEEHSPTPRPICALLIKRGGVDPHKTDQQPSEMRFSRMLQLKSNKRE